MTQTLTTEQKTILIDTCKVMINREATSDYSANLREVAKVALSTLTANLEAQPVYQCRLFTTDVDGKQIGEWQDMDKGFYDQYDPYCRRILYTAPPAPAVPEETDLDSARMAVGFNRYIQAGYVDGWNACRAAMLAAAPDGGN